jgi:DNA-binding IclR family transcriptional regulator
MKSAAKVFQVLESICSEGPVTLTELTRKLNEKKSSVHRFLSVLSMAGYVEKDGYSRKYYPTLKIFQLGVSARNRKFSLHLARPYMEALSGQCGETVNLGLFMDGKVIVIERVESSEPLRTDLGVGTGLPAHCTAMGKVFLSELSEEDLDRHIQRHGLRGFTSKTATSPETLKKDLKTVRERGFSLDDGELGEGIRCIAAPVRGVSGRVSAALSITGPGTRLSLKKLNGLRGPLVRLAAEMGAKLG